MICAVVLFVLIAAAGVAAASGRGVHDSRDPAYTLAGHAARPGRTR